MPPPSFVQKVQSIGNIISALNNICNFKYNLKILKYNEVKISKSQLLHLNKNGLNYYTFESKEHKMSY